MTNYDNAISAVLSEIERAKAKWPGWPEDIVHGAAVVAEEAGELVQASLDAAYSGGSVDRAIEEAIHAAATAIRFISETKRDNAPV